MSAHSDGTALIRSDAVTNAAQPNPSLQLGRRLRREESLDIGHDRENSREKLTQVRGKGTT